MIKVMLIACLLFLQASCSNEIGNQQTGKRPDNPLLFEKKYYLKDCMVMLEFDWKGPLNYKQREEVTNKIGDQIKIIIVENNFPLFSGHTNSGRDYYVIYFVNDCPDRVQLSQKLVHDYFLPNIKGFPAYAIKSQVKPGFDGITPSGWWLGEE